MDVYHEQNIFSPIDIMKVAVFLLCLLPLVFCAPSDIDKRWIVDRKCLQIIFVKKKKKIFYNNNNKTKQISKKENKNTSHTYKNPLKTKSNEQHQGTQISLFERFLFTLEPF